MTIASGRHKHIKAGGAKSSAATGRSLSKNVPPKFARVGKAGGLTSLPRKAKARVALKMYKPDTGVDRYVAEIASATPFEIVEIERSGVPGVFIKDLSKRMEISSTRIFKILGVPKATIEKKVASGKMIAGSGGQAAIGMARLIALANEIAANSTAKEAKSFDAAKWLGQWIERPQPSLGGRKPADLLDTPTGLEVVVRVLGAAESGAYQ